MFKVYYSKLESKIKLVFDMYDFDGDGKISKEDVRIILVYVPIQHFSKEEQKKAEGKFTQEGGGLDEFGDIVDIHKQIKIFLDYTFDTKETLNMEEFT